MESSVHVRNVHKSFQDGKERKLPVLQGIELDIRARESTAIIGKSGCGKSTLLHIIGQLIQPDSGTVDFGLGGQEVTAAVNGPVQRARIRNTHIGYVVQDFALLEDESALNNVMLPLHYARRRFRPGQKRAESLAALQKVELAERAATKVSVLSGGQRQRIAIARAIVNRPVLILADEPTGALDEETAGSVLKLLHELVAEGTSLLLVTHNIELARTCHHVYTLSDGILHPYKQ